MKKLVYFDNQFNEFNEQQKTLASRIDRGVAKLVYIDPDGTWSDYVMLVVEHHTGVIYGNQCCGMATRDRYVEGFLVPCDGLQTDADDGFVSSAMLTAPFHKSVQACSDDWFDNVPKESLEELIEVVRRIPFWHHYSLDNCTREALEIDLDRVHEICEAWVPVKTALGSGILLWKNCD